MKQIEIEEVRKIQMDVLTNLDQFCREHKIIYSIADGTLLGAVRHKGYIPWDDDIDVFMLRLDYEKMVSLFPKVYNEHYVLASLETDEKWARAYANLYDNRTLLIEDANGENIGVNIDIFPVDEVPDTKDELCTYFKGLKRLNSLYIIKSLKWRGKRSLLKNLVVFFSQLLLCMVSQRWIAQRIDIYSQKYNGMGYSKVYECCFGVSSQKPFPKQLFDDVKQYPFEDRYFWGLSNFDLFLTQAYGDYMQLPPVEKRITHHAYSAFWK